MPSFSFWYVYPINYPSVLFIKLYLVLLQLLHNPVPPQVNGEIPGAFTVYFEQNGKRIDPAKGAVTLSAAPFDLVIELPEKGGVLVNASLEPFTYKPAHKGKPKEKLLGFVNPVLQEGYLNKGKEILLADDAPAYWFYENDSTHSFNTVVNDNGAFICKRRIEKITFAKTGQKEVIEGNMPSLYLVFMRVQKTATGKELELRRFTVVVNFTKA